MGSLEHMLDGPWMSHALFVIAHGITQCSMEYLFQWSMITDNPNCRPFQQCGCQIEFIKCKYKNIMDFCKLLIVILSVIKVFSVFFKFIRSFHNLESGIIDDYSICKMSLHGI